MTCPKCGVDKIKYKQMQQIVEREQTRVKYWKKEIEQWKNKALQYKNTWLKKVATCDKCNGPYGHCSCD